MLERGKRKLVSFKKAGWRTNGTKKKVSLIRSDHGYHCLVDRFDDIKGMQKLWNARIRKMPSTLGHASGEREKKQ